LGARGPAVSWAPRLLGLLITTAAAASVFVACGGSSEGTVVTKTGQGSYDHACEASSTPTGPVAVPVWAACSAPRCWRLIVRNRDGDLSQPCVSRAEYDSARVGAFWHRSTDR
jgi:hypothetical protein